MNIPIVRLEIEGMKHSVQTALTEYIMQMDEDIHVAIEKVITPDNISLVISDSVARTLKDVLQTEIDSLFRYGDGRRVLRKTVRSLIWEHLSKDRVTTDDTGTDTSESVRGSESGDKESESEDTDDGEEDGTSEGGE